MTIYEHDRVSTGWDDESGAKTTHALVDRLTAGEPFAVAFGGQGSAWLETLEELVSATGIESELATLAGEAELLLEPVARELVVVRPIGFEPLRWVRALAAEEPVPTAKQLTSAAVSVPGVLLTQVAAVRALARQGMDLFETPPVATAGHSQGVLAVEALAAQGAKDVELLALAQLIGAAGTLVARRRGITVLGDRPPMVSVTHADPERIYELLEEFSTDVRTVLPPVLSIRNGRRSVVITGTPEQLSRFELYCTQIAEREEAERKNKLRGGAVFAPAFDPVQVEVGFHTPRLADGIDIVGRWAEAVGLDVALARQMAEALLVNQVDWVDEVAELHDAGARWILDLGPGDILTRLTAPVIRGLGVGIVPAATRGGQRNLFTVGAVPEVARPWSSYTPTAVQLPDGSVKLSTKFTRLTGRSPILLAGMTPTTVDAKIVAAAANAGHWAELAGGGQVTEEIFNARIAELVELLEPGRAVQFNSLFLDPYLWKLQLGGKRLVQKARQSGAPIDGVVVTAGIPELEEAVDLIDELNGIGISHVVFKPGTVEQIRSVIRIAAEVPTKPVIVHIEGGRAGGHHSWEDLDDLLLTTYSELRSRSNITICVGGGIGTPERAAEYLSGRWSQVHGFPVMPVDGILVGTAAMAALEATTSPVVKQLLVDTTGTDQWVGAGKAQGGMASGRSQLGADIHEIDNAASRCGRLLDEVAGDADAVAERRDEIIAAMAATAKPYFGDVAEMTYLQWLARYVELAIGDGGSTADTNRAGSPWLDITWRDRFAQMLQRAEARLHPQDHGPIDTVFSGSAGSALLETPQAAIDALVNRYPDAETVLLHPADVPFFVQLCKTLGKPVNFVPVIDKDVRRWWRSDSLWQAHDARYTADQVCIIPGTAAVAGITRVDEPVGELLDRFEQAAVDEVLAADGGPRPVTSRRQGRTDVDGPLAVLLDAPDVLWAGRTAVNPVHRIAASADWQVRDEGRTATHASTGARLEVADDQHVRGAGAERPGEQHVRGAGAERPGEQHVVLSVPLSGTWIDIRFTLTDVIRTGGAPLVTTEDAATAMRSVLAIAAGVDGPDALPPVQDGTATATVVWDPELVADHTGVTATFGAPLAPTLTVVPDALVGRCWPAVFAAIGSAATDSGFPVVEGLLSLVHLDHGAQLVAALPKDRTELTVTATAGTATDTEVGRVVPVSVTVTDADGTLLATLEERFAIRGRTGAAELSDPVRAGGAISDNATDTPRRRRRDVTVGAPVDMRPFAVVSGDHNPIHTDRAAALLAGLESPIVHGMWLSAAAQHVVTATDGKAIPPARLVGWTARFLGMVLPGDEIDFRVDRVGIDVGAEVLEVTAKVGADLVMSATARLAAPKTVYAFPGQGIQHKGMGMEVRARSKVARKVWDSADKFTRERLGFSVLHVVRDNPTSLIASGVHYQHPEGVLYLTQFTQVAMATVAAAQVAEMREQGAFVEGAIACGHSVGEYTALACVSGVYELEALLEVVFHRGSKMHDIVPRDELGRSNYRLAAIRPSQIDLDDADVKDFVAEIAARTGEFLEIVNFNLRGSQYAIAGTIRGLEALEEEIERRRELSGGKRSFILVPGIDVPFHSSVLRVGVADFRRSLERVMPRDADPELLIGKYIPNLVPRPFTLDRDFIEEIRDLVPAEPLDEILADYDTWRSERPRELCRKIVIELLAWQFASPVRWIETQDLLFIEEAAGGLGVERFVEIGVKSAPTVAGLATNTLKLPEYSHSTVEVLNSERDAAVLFATDEDPVEDSAPEPEAEAPAAETAQPAESPAPAAPAVPAAPSGGPRPDDITFDAADATVALVALSAKMRLDQIEALDSIETITDGASSRRNQMLVDLGSELNLGAIDGAAEADLGALKAQVTKLARTYRPFGPVLSDAINDQLRTVLGPSGKRPAYIAERVGKAWELGAGWAKHVTVEVALGTREGSSVRGGSLGGLHDGALADAATVDKVIDAAVAAVAARHGIAVSLPSAGGGGGGVVDSAALGEFAQQVTGGDGVLANAARLVLGQLGLDTPVTPSESATDAELIDLVTAELGADWPRLVAPSFDVRKAVVFDDRWASAREDLVKIWLADEDDIDTDWPKLSERFEGAGHVVATQATWWQGRALAAGRQIHASLFARIAAGAENPGKGRYSDEVAVVTGASKGSIAAAVVAQLLDGGATVIATTSRLDDARLAFYKTLYRDNARYDAKLWVVPANMASYSDIDALVKWVGTEQVESLGPQSIHLKDAQTPTLLFPFAAPRVAGDMSEVGSRSEMEMKVLLWAVQRLIGGLSSIGAERDIASRLHVVLPGSPNRGMFGGDGAYGEAKSALDALVTRWSAESSWAQRVSLAHALIGWTKGTGLMGHNDAIAGAVEEAGVTTYTTAEMASMLLSLCDIESKVAAAREPIKADLTGGLGDIELDMAALAAKAREEMSADAADEDPDAPAPGTVAALPSPPRGYTPAPPPEWAELDVDPADLVVIVSGAELGPYGSSRTRFEMEVDNELSAAGVLELAWTTGMIKWEDDPKPGWYDAASGDLVPEEELVERYHDAVVQRCGIREFVDDGAIDPDHASPLLVSVFLDKDFSFVVSSEEEARAFVDFDPEHTVVRPVPDSSDWQVIRKAGTEIRVPRKTKLSRTVGAQIPTGFDPTVWGITSDMANSIDRVALWNIVATVDAFLSAGFTPTELMRWVHPSLVASTQGTGMGGMTSMQTMYHGNLLGRSKPNDILQEVLPNVVAAHVVQSYIGSYGAMIHPVGACATAAVSVEEGVDKIRLGKAELVVAGGFDDLTLEAIIGFGDMAATADTETMRAKGISDSKFSRANDRRRLGFVEAQGGGTILLARGDLAVRMGLPVLAVVAYAQSFADGVHTSIPAPGLGALGAGRGGKDSMLARSLNKLGVAADDISVIYKHDTSTLANDPNETELHERLADSLGRSDGAPMFIVSQKTLTGHAKGGAAVFQMMGLCQVLRDGVIPPNRSLDCVDDEMATSGHFVWPRETLRMGEKFPLKAGLVTSLGFGHVSGLIALVHPQAFLATLDSEQRDAYVERAEQRTLAGQRRLASAIAGGRPMYERPDGRRFSHDEPEKRQEAAMLLDAASRLGDGDVYIR